MKKKIHQSIIQSIKSSLCSPNYRASGQWQEGVPQGWNLPVSRVQQPGLSLKPLSSPLDPAPAEDPQGSAPPPGHSPSSLQKYPGPSTPRLTSAVIASLLAFLPRIIAKRAFLDDIIFLFANILSF